MVVKMRTWRQAAGVTAWMICLGALLACADAPGGDPADSVGVQPEFSLGCSGSQAECDAIGNAITALQSHSNSTCRAFGEEAAERFNDPHWTANSFSNQGSQYTPQFLENLETHQAHSTPSQSPDRQGTSHVHASSADPQQLRAEIAGNEAFAQGYGYDNAYSVCYN